MTAGAAATRAGRALRALVAIVALALIVGGIPLGLVAYVGWPLPRAIPTLEELLRGLNEPGLPDELLINTLAVFCWLAWAQFTVSLALEIVAVLRSRPVSRLPLGGPIQTIAGWLVGALLLSTVPLIQRAASAATVAPTDAILSGSTRQRTPVSAPLRPGPPVEDARAAPPRQAPEREHPVYVVRRYDTLWGIAETCLGDGRRWPQIYRLNEGREQPDGGRLTDADLIYPGWRLRLPPDARLPRPARPPQHTDPAAPAPAPTTPPPTQPAAPSSTTTTPQPSTTAASPVSTPAPAANRDTPEREPHRAPGGISIQLPSGSVVSAAFAAGMLSALALVRIRDRRRRQPQLPAPGIRDHDSSIPEPLRWLMRVADPATDPTAELTEPVPTATRPQPSPPTGVAAALGHGPLIGERSGKPLYLDVVTLGAVSLLGAGADDLARAIVATMLTTAGPEAAEVYLLTDRLLKGIPQLPGLHRPASLAQALPRLEAELVRRTRLFAEAGAEDLAAYRRHTDLEPVPSSLLVLDHGDAMEHASRLRALVEQGRRLGIAVLILADDPVPGTAVIEVETDGEFATAAPAELRAAIDGARLHTLTEPDAVDLLGVLARARADDHSAFPGNIEGVAGGDSVATSQPASGPAPSGGLEAEPVRQFDPPAPSPQAISSRRLRVRLFGIFRIQAGDSELGRGLLKKAREMLALYALHPDGLPLEAATEALWPGADPDRGPQRFWSALTNLRKLARHALGYDDTEQFELISKVGDRYRLDPNAVDIDLWRFQAALRDAARARQAGDATGELAALARAASAYGGPLLAGTYYEWRVGGQRDVEAEREDLRRRATDALTRLAELHQAGGDHAAAAAALERAIDLDPAAEELYRRLMRLQHRMGRRDAVRRTYQRLEAALTDLGAEPEDATERVFRQALGDGKRAPA